MLYDCKLQRYEYSNSKIAEIIIVKNGPTPASFSFIFGLFKQIIQQINVKEMCKCPSSIRRRDSNPRPFEP